MKFLKTIIIGVLIMAFFKEALYAQKLTLQSPNKKTTIELFNQQNGNAGEWYLKVLYTEDAVTTESISRIDLGLVRADQAFSKELTFLKSSRPLLINEHYTSVHGKRSVRNNTANEIIASFRNPNKAKINLIIRAYNDGVAFRYEFPDGQDTVTIKDELTAFTISKETSRWMEKWNAANEGYYTPMSDDKVQQQEWSYPALFNTKNKACWFLLHEADLDRNYCGTKLSNTLDATKYKLTFPDPRDGRGTGTSEPTINSPWKSPWRVVIMGTLQDIVASTLIDDLSAPSVIKNTDWIKPGPVSWNYWSSNHGTKDYKIVTRFADLAADMNWPYTLLDWEWDGMGNGGNLEDALNYIHAKGIKPLM